MNNEKTPFLTIGIASYNYAHFLKRAFEQIKKQKFVDFELLYCDDGSTDESVEIIKNIIVQNINMSIRLIQNTHKGILANKNSIIQNAKGKYILICDADDFMFDDCLFELCSVAQLTDADCVIGGFQEIDEKNKLLKVHIPTQNSSKWLFTWHHAQIYKKNILDKYQIEFKHLPDDVYYLQQIHMYCECVAFVPKIIYSWVRHSKSSSIDIKNNPEWNPVTIWTQLSFDISNIRETVADNDKTELDYYLYKWFYFNIADLPVCNKVYLKDSIGTMSEMMHTVLPDYKKHKRLFQALQTKDTKFARIAVLCCWVLEKIGFIKFVSYCRTLQSCVRSLRKW